MATQYESPRSKIFLSLGDSQIELEWIEVKEALGEPYLIEAYVLSKLDEIFFLPHLGKPARFQLNPHDGSKEFHGYLFDVHALPSSHAGSHYRLTIRPWLYLLGQGSNYRMFQNKSVLDIVESVLQDSGNTDVSFDRLTANYQPREYCLQYRESDAAFISRLLEEEGIYYYFEHEEERHVLVLCDNPKSHKPIDGEADVPFADSAETTQFFQGCIWNWEECVSSAAQAKVTLRDFDFERPTKPLEAMNEGELEHPLDAIEVYDYPARYVDGTDGNRVGQFMLEGLRSKRFVYRGEAGLGMIACGRTFTLKDHPCERFNQEYLITEVAYRSHNEAFESAGASGPKQTKITFVAIPAVAIWRSPLHTPKPVARGPETAIVTGPPGEEIFTDAHGRVKVRFHWDRSDTKDEESSCWIRVSYPWAGGGFGGIQIPRIGQEVIVDFLSGDPDRPIITGRVFNAERMPPHALPGAAVKSGFKSQTVKGQGSNEFTFDDTAGSEQVYMHAQFDHVTMVEHDETMTVKNNRTRTVNVNETLTVDGNRNRTVNGTEDVHVVGNRTRTADANEALTVGVNRTRDVGSNETVTVGANQTLTVGANQTVDVGGKQAVTVSGNATLDTQANREVTAAAAYKLQAMTVEVTADVSITLTCGPSSIKIDPTGVKVMAPMIQLN